MRPTCEVCWSPIEGDRYEYDGTTMCEECFDRTVPTLDDLKRVVLDGNDPVWRGAYLLESGNRLRCHEFSDFDEEDWEEEGVTGSVYFEIDRALAKGGFLEDADGGEFGYFPTSVFGSFCSYLESVYGETVLQKVSDDHRPGE